MKLANLLVIAQCEQNNFVTNLYSIYSIFVDKLGNGEFEESLSMMQISRVNKLHFENIELPILAWACRVKDFGVSLSSSSVRKSNS